LTLSSALELLAKAEVAERPLGHCPETQRPIYLKEGRFGTYVQMGAPDDETKQNASLLKGMTPGDVNLEVALQLLLLPRTLGPHPQTGEPVVAHNGRFGPYVKCGAETRSLLSPSSPLMVSLDEALSLLAQPKQMRGRGAPREPLRQFEVSPVTQKMVQVMDGRFGPYLTDGTTNFSVPKGVEIGEITAEQALQWLAERAAQGPSTRGRGRKKGTTTAPRKKSAPRKSASATKKGANTKGGTKKSATKKGATKKSATEQGALLKKITKGSQTAASTKRKGSKKSSSA